MNIKTNKKDLLKVLSTAIKAVPSKAPFPMMENFLLMVEDSLLHVIATDGGITVSTSIEAEGEGEACVNAKLILDAITLLPDADIVIEESEGHCNIRYEKGQFSIPSFDANDFPDVEFAIEGNAVKMSCGELKSALNYVAPSIAKDTLRPQLCGVYFNPVADGHDIVTSDSRTLSLQKIKSEGDNCGNFVLPNVTAKFLRDQLPDDDSEVSMSADETHVSFAFGKTVINSVKVVGKFPNYEMVIPVNNENKLTAKVDDMLAVVRRVSTCANKASNAIKFTLSTLGGATIESQDIGFGCAAQETMDDIAYNGQDMVIGFKHDILTALLSAVDEENVVISMDSPKRAALITSDNESRKAIIMPVSVAVTQ